MNKPSLNLRGRREILNAQLQTAKRLARRSDRLVCHIDWHERILFDRDVANALSAISLAFENGRYRRLTRTDFSKLYARTDAIIDRLAEHIHVWEMRLIHGIEFGVTPVPKHVPKRTREAVLKHIAAFKRSRELRRFRRNPRPNAETLGIAQNCTMPEASR